ncbi:MAG: hypothetical protein CL568_08070 [Alphaproteobacteria bacterium]|nr:hypothetical protein [Alphaproteobacteria bacterium]
MDSPCPLIGVSGELKDFNGFDVQAAGHKYVYSVVEAFNGIPIILPALGIPEPKNTSNLIELLDRVDGIILTGGRANVEPHHYGGEPFRPETHRDPVRDAMTLPLVRSAVELSVPILGICRGIQEINVALGGTLHPYLWEVEGKNDHRMPKTDIMENRFAPRHKISLTEKGYFSHIADKAKIDKDQIIVNSLHSQAINKLADGLEIEALSEDGVIEGVSMPKAKSFVVGVQWHAEFRVTEHPFNMALYSEFGEATKRRAIDRFKQPNAA